MGNQELSVIWKILKIIKILMRMIYLMLSPLMLVKIILTMKVINLLQKDDTSQITIHHLRCMLIFQNIKYKR